ncbi:hypothetical protein ACNVED_16335 (plasmid) [Legionella sp. D16C41]|uniref:hypothetical protein n=1 Tax=Legionella sp. D16C41 TaxID=3402688 RepID=UPI003AF432AE
MYTINIIGAGRLGKTIGKLIVINKAGSIQGICNQSIKSSILAAQYIGEGEIFNKISELPSADITFITTPDENIKNSARELSKSDYLKRNSTILHCSGALMSSELESLKSKDCNIASVHPMHSFASPDISVHKFKNTYCAMEGDDDAKKILGQLFSNIGV